MRNQEFKALMKPEETKPLTPYYSETIQNLLSANGQNIYHPRTGELIVGVSGDIRPKRPNNRSLGRFPRAKYHQVSSRSIGRTMRSRVVESPFGVSKILVFTARVTVGKPRRHWKSVYFTAKETRHKGLPNRLERQFGSVQCS